MARTQERELRGRIVQEYSRRESDGSTQVWAVCRFRCEDGTTHTVEGVFSPEDLEARALTIRGRVRQDRQGRERFVASWVWRGQLAGWADAPPTEGLVQFLVEGGLKGLLQGYSIGPARARALGEALGTQLWDALTLSPEVLAPHVRGMANATEIHQAIEELGHSRVNALARLMTLNLSLARANRVLDHLGLRAVEQIREDPYVMSTVPGIAFSTADDIARGRMEITADDPRRLRAMARAVLVDAARKGWTSVPREDVLKEIHNLGQRDGVGVDAEEVLRFARESHAVAEDYGDVYLPGILKNEQLLARSAARLSASKARRLPVDQTISGILADLTEEQAQAVVLALTERISIITGPPGSGKTHVIRAIQKIAEHLDIPVALTASTGKAADRINAAIDPDSPDRARTTHSVIGTYTHPKALPDGVVVGDEVSMLDLETSARLVAEAANSDGRSSLVLIGDPEQLESVMAGAVFRDLCDSGVIATTRLTKVFRQDRNSLIGINGERIRRGKRPFFHDARLSARDLEEINSYFAGEPLSLGDIRRDCYMVPAGSPEYGAKRVIDVVLRWAERGYDPKRDIMVASPRRDGQLGTNNLNATLQETLNSEGEPLQLGEGRSAKVVCDKAGLPLRIGDPVLQTVNEDQKAGIINGTRGFVVGVEGDSVVIDWGKPGRRTYSRSDVRRMELAYAGTVHKAQGDQVPIMIVAMHEAEHFINLKRSLLTVAWTRATQNMVFVGTQKSLHIALSTVDKRHTRLAERTRHELEVLKEEIGQEESLASLLPERVARILREAEDSYQHDAPTLPAGQSKGRRIQ